MKIVFSVLLCSLLSSTVWAQINVGTMDLAGTKAGKFHGDMLQRLKNSTTIFVYQDGDKQNVEQLKQVFEQHWTISNLMLLSKEEFLTGTYNPSHSFFLISGYDNGLSSHLYLQLFMYDGKKKNVFARVELFPKENQLFRHAKLFSEDLEERITYSYQDLQFRNWNAGYLKNYIQELNAYLATGENVFLFDSYTKPSAQGLATATLYFPEESLLKYHARKGTEEEKHDLAELMKQYGYGYKAISTQALSDKILEGSEPFFYVNYVRGGARKYLSIVNGLTGEVVYYYFDNVSYNLEQKDFKSLSSAIKKQK